MSRKTTPTQAELARSIKAMQAAGYANVRVEHDMDGKITVTPGELSNVGDDSALDLTKMIQRNQEKES